MARGLPAHLPQSYLKLMEALRALPGDEPTVWIGEAGFRRALFSEVDPEAHIQRLLEERWPAMHPDLLPFAIDGAGNRYCLVWTARADGRGDGFVACWQYETYHALPIASSVQAFLDWLGLTTAFAARQGVHPVLDRAHLETDVLPLLAGLRPGQDYSGPFVSADVELTTLHREIVARDPAAPASLLWLASESHEAENSPRAVERANHAIQAFPDLCGAWMARAHWRLMTERTEALFDELQALACPLAWSGDPQMPWYGGVAMMDPNSAAEDLATSGEFAEEAIHDPLWEIILHEDPHSAEAWSRLALDYVDDNDLDRALTMAQNALHLGFQDGLAPQCAALLADLYDALDSPWHEALTRADEKRLEARVRARTDAPSP